MIITLPWLIGLFVVFCIMFCIIMGQMRDNNHLSFDLWVLKDELKKTQALLDQRTKETQREFVERLVAKMDSDHVR